MNTIRGILLSTLLVGVVAMAGFHLSRGKPGSEMIGIIMTLSLPALIVVLINVLRRMRR